MSQVAGQGTIWNLPNYWGELFTADMVNTPFLSMIGDLAKGGLTTDNFKFPTSVEYDFASPSQPAITETDSLTAPTASEAVREQKFNVTQIFQQAVKISYVKMSNAGRLSGINTAGKKNDVQKELAFQINYNLEVIARQIEYTILNGAYQVSTAANVANKTRGMLAVCDIAGSSSVDGGSADLSTALVDSILRLMHSNGAVFKDIVIFANAYQKQAITSLYTVSPRDRNIGGSNIEQIETDFGTIGVARPHRFMPTDDILFAEMSVIKPVTQPVPGKGNFFYEMLSKTGASENGQIFGQFGLDHGPAFMHGKIHSLADS